MPIGRAAHGGVEVGVGKHDVRRLAAELERDVLQRVGRARMIPLPVDVSPVNAILSMPGCSTIAWPTRRAGPVMTLRTPGGKPTSLRDLAERERGERRLARRLDDHGVAARQRRRDLPRRQQQRKIPRHDRRDDADRLAQRVGEVVALDRHRLAVDLVGPAGEVLEALGGRGHLDLPRLEDRLAVVQRLEPRDLVGPLHQPLAELPDAAGRARARRQLAPRPGRAPPAPRATAGIDVAPDPPTRPRR